MKILFFLLFTVSLFGHAYGADYSQFCKKAKRKAKAAHEEVRSLKNSLLMGCQRDQEWMQQIRKNVCKENYRGINREKLNSLDLPRAFYFSFDGAASFNARKALQVDPSIVNLTGEEGRDLTVGSFYGGGVILSQIHYLSSDIHYESRYYSGSGIKLTENYSSALSCAKHIDEYLDVMESLGIEDYEKPLMIAIGHSNGGIDAIRVQNDLPKVSRRGFDLVLTIDPIAKVLMYHPSKLKRFAGQRNKMTKTFINYYQRIDHSSLGGELATPFLGDVYIGFKFKGSPVRGADLNFELTMNNNEAFREAEGFRSHMRIVNTNRIWERFTKELRMKLYND